MNKINKILSKTLGIEIRKHRPEEMERLIIREVIPEAVKHFGDKEIVACEIGTYKGQHALRMLQNLNIKKLYIVDPYAHYDEFPDYRKEDLSLVEREAKKLLKDYEDRIVWIKDFSEDAINQIGEMIDLIYIDGNHEYPYIKQDLYLYYDLLRRGGIIAGHDFSNRTGVIQAVNEFKEEFGLNVILLDQTEWMVKEIFK